MKRPKKPAPRKSPQRPEPNPTRRRAAADDPAQLTLAKVTPQQLALLAELTRRARSSAQSITAPASSALAGRRRAARTTVEPPALPGFERAARARAEQRELAYPAREPPAETRAVITRGIDMRRVLEPIAQPLIRTQQSRGVNAWVRELRATEGGALVNGSDVEFAGFLDGDRSDLSGSGRGTIDFDVPDGDAVLEANSTWRSFTEHRYYLKVRDGRVVGWSGKFEKAREWLGLNPPTLDEKKREVYARQAQEAIAREKQLAMPKLTGSEKQVAWASTLRDRYVRELADVAPSILPWLALRAPREARWWIDNREIRTTGALIERIWREGRLRLSDPDQRAARDDEDMQAIGQARGSLLFLAYGAIPSSKRGRPGLDAQQRAWLDTERLLGETRAGDAGVAAAYLLQHGTELGLSAEEAEDLRDTTRVVAEAKSRGARIYLGP